MPFRKIEIPSLGRRLSNVMAAPASAAAELTEQGLDQYRHLGGNCLYLHGEGGETESRRLAGQWLRRQGKRDDFFLCGDICHDDWDEEAKRAIDRFTPEAAAEDVAINLDLLGTTYLDLVYLEDRPQAPFEPMIEAMGREMARGRVRAWGVSNWGVARLRAANDFARRAGGQGMAAVLTTELALAKAAHPLWPEYLPMDEGMKEAIGELGLAVFAHALDLNLGQTLFGDADGLARGRREWVQRWEGLENRRVVERVERVAKATGLTAREINVAWVLNQKFPTVGIVHLPALLERGADYERASEHQFSAAETAGLSGPA